MMKKLFSLTLAMVTALGLMLPASAAEETTDEALARVTQAVKAALDLDTDAYDEFQGSWYEDGLTGAWDLYWSTELEEELSISALDDGTVISYDLGLPYTASNSGDFPVFPQGDEAAAARAAGDFLDKVLREGESVKLEEPRGMDILGALYSSRLPDLLAYDAMHLEWWTNDFQFSSLTTCLFWVFNQTVGAWLATVCFLQEKDCRNYLLLGTACLMCGPFPFVGLVIFMVVRGIVLLAQRQKGVLQSAFSPANVLVLVVVLSITASYFLANNAFGYSVLGETVAGNQAAQQTFGQNVLTSLQKGMLVFYLLDAGIYLLLLWRQNRRSWLFYTCAVSLFIIPFFKVGQGCDFCMRVSIPAIFILMTLCARYFIALVGTKWRDGTLARHAVTILLAATLLIGACTPAMEIYRGICHIAKEGTFCLENEEPYTLADRPVSLNFETQNCENKLFFTYFAK